MPYGECLNGIPTVDLAHLALIWRFGNALMIQNSAKNYTILAIVIAKILKIA